MCGIAGVFSDDGPPDVQLVRRMIARLAHRGPDGWGYFRDEQVALGHARLAVIDTAGGTQPLCNEDGHLWVVFNGEIFNYVELADQLRGHGHTFRTASDTEVIVHAWEQWGPDCFNRFNGQWALAIWDTGSRQLILSRDRLGVRPLYYLPTRSGLVFASEVKAIFADPAIHRELDPVGLDQILTFWSTVAPQTPFKGVKQVVPGTYVTVGASGVVHHHYWSPEFPQQGEEPGQDIEENSARLRELIVRATRLRFLRSDVPVGAYLSGGLDSAVTASVIANLTDVPLHTFSLRFTESEFDEGGYQDLLARQLGSTHESIQVSLRDIAESFPETVWHAEAPMLRTGPTPMFLLSKLVRDRGFKVVVTGEGADEILAGYDIFREARVRMFWARDPHSRVRGRAAELLYPWMVRSPGSAPAFARAFFGRSLDLTDPALSHRPRWDSSAIIKSMLNADVRAEMTEDPVATLLSTLPDTSAYWDPLSRSQWLEMKTLLAGYILASQGDRMLMAHSIEGRFPFLDRDVMEFSNALPARHKLLGLDEKHLLKRAFQDLVPREILRRDKQPYRAPDAAAFFSGVSPPWLDDVASVDAIRRAGVFQPALVGRLFEKCRRRAGHGMSNTDNMRVVAVLSTQLVHNQYVLADGAGWSPTQPRGPRTVIDLVDDGRGNAH